MLAAVAWPGVARWRLAMRWLEPRSVEVPRQFREAIGGHPLVAETLVRRGVATIAEAQAFLDPNAYVPAPAEDLPGMAAAVARVWRAVQTGEPILVWGDFDVDGQTATTVLVVCLRDLGADVRHRIPVRETESHGIALPSLAEELSTSVSLIITCDTGIDAAEAVAYAAAHGVDVVVTDHHELPTSLPQACAIVNPHFLPEGHPLGTLPGVGVAYKLAEALYAKAGRGMEASGLLDLVALGIVADVAVQRGETRYLLQRGLQALRETRRLGLQELMKLAGIKAASLDEESIGFALAPRLNALGRLSDANPIVDFFTTDELTRARVLASELEALNARRRMMCDQVDAAAEERLQADTEQLRGAAIVLADPHWPAGIIGIVANRLAERHRRPVVLLSAPPGARARGSARSVEGCHITEAIATQRELLDGFGGHAMAAGLALDPAHIESFRRGLNRAVAAQLTGQEVEPALEVHGYVALSELTLALVDDLARLGPFGPGNPPLTLVARDVEIVGKRPLGRNGRHVQITIEDREKDQRAVVWWNWDGASIPGGRVDLAFSAGVNEFRGKTEVRLVWRDARASVAGAIEVAAQAAGPLCVEDWRGAADAERRLAELLARDAAIAVWDEGQVPGAWSGERHHRFALPVAETLVVWVRPPSPAVLRSVVERVAPTRVVLVGRGGVAAEMGEFLNHLAGLVKYAIGQKGGMVDIADLAARMGHREVSVRWGLAWLVAKGIVRVEERGDQSVALTIPGAADVEQTKKAGEQLVEALKETAAYERFFMTKDVLLVMAGAGRVVTTSPNRH